MKRSLLAVVAAAGVVGAAVFAFVAPAGAATTVTIYNSSTQPLPGNFPSEGPEAYSFSEFGDGIAFAGAALHPVSAIVTMSSFACQVGAWNTHDCASAPKSTFSQPITLNIYAPPVTGEGGQVYPGGLIATVTQTFDIPYRPSANVQKCNTANNSLGEWYDKTAMECDNGKATNVTFSLKALHLDLPDEVVFGISYNTTHYGPNPIGESAPCYGTPAGCPYDSLNIALNDGAAPTTGAQLYPGTVFQNAAVRGDYCDGTPTVGVFNLDSPTSACWTGYVPAIRITAR